LSIKSTPVKQTPVRSAPMNQTAVKTQRASSAVVAAKNTAALRPVGSSPNVSPAVAAVGQKKPSAGIPKETPQN
jgi:hypothetical protein